MFYESFAFNQDISSWDVSSVIDMELMFHFTYVFNQDIGSWDVSSVRSMSQMFGSAFEFNQDLSGWCVQSNFSSEPDDFRRSAKLDWRLDEAKQPVWDGVDGSAENCN